MQNRLIFILLALVIIAGLLFITTNAFCQNANHKYGQGRGATVRALADTASAIRADFPAGSVGDIEGVTAGINITGGGTSGTVTVNADTTVGSTKLATQNFVRRAVSDSVGGIDLNRLTDVDLAGASAGSGLVRRASGVWVDSTLAPSAAGGWTDEGAGAGTVELSTASDRVYIGNFANTNAYIGLMQNSPNPLIVMRDNDVTPDSAYLRFDDANDQFEIRVSGTSPSINLESNVILSNAGGNAWGLLCLTSSGTTTMYVTNSTNGETTSDGTAVSYSGAVNVGSYKIDSQEPSGTIELATGGGSVFIDAGDNGTNELDVTSAGVVTVTNSSGAFQYTVASNDTAKFSGATGGYHFDNGTDQVFLGGGVNIRTSAGTFAISGGAADLAVFSGASAYQFDANVAANAGLGLGTSGAINYGDISGGRETFATNAEVDTVLISGAATTDIYTFTLMSAPSATVTGQWVEAKADTAIFHLVGTNTEVAQAYSWTRGKE